MTRVLLVTNGLLYGGAERIVEALALDLTARGHAVRVVATTRDGPIGDALRAEGIPVDVLGIASATDVRVVQQLSAIAYAFSPDVVHSHLAVADIATAAAPLPPHTRRISTVHNSGVELSLPKRLLWQAALHRFDRVVAVGEHVAQALPRTLAAVTLSPSLVEASRPHLTRAEAREALGVPIDAPLVLAVGRLAHVKGFDLLAPRTCVLRTRGALVRVIGEGPERATLEAAGLTLLGARADAAALMVGADVVVCPSRSEGFPQVPLQAMAAARPVVATRVGGTPEIVQHGTTGVLVPPDDPEALALALDRVLGDRELAEAQGQAGLRHLVLERLTRPAMVEKHLTLYAGR